MVPGGGVKEVTISLQKGMRMWRQERKGVWLLSWNISLSGKEDLISTTCGAQVRGCGLGCTQEGVW